MGDLVWADTGALRESLAELGLLDGLDESACDEREELVAWLLEQGFGLEQIRAEVAGSALAVVRHENIAASGTSSP